jgi:hypothetical protein
MNAASSVMLAMAKVACGLVRRAMTEGAAYTRRENAE